MDNSLVYIKIHKCSSTSVRLLLENDYAKKNNLKVVMAKNKTNDKIQRRFFRKENKNNHRWVVDNKPYDIFARHEAYDNEFFENFMATPINYITFLREPLSRAISSFYSMDVPPTPNIFKNQKFSDWYIKYNELINKLSDFDNDMNFWVLNSNFMSYMCGFDTLDEITEENIKNRFTFIGITENFNESINALGNILKHNFNKNLLDRKIRKNHNKPKENISEEFINIFKENNKLDYKLYELVKKINYD